MKLNTDKAILFIEPKHKASKSLIIDNYTKRMYNSLYKAMVNENSGHCGFTGNFEKGIQTMGMHTCICGALSHSRDYLLDGNVATNSLCVHYLVYHRDEVPQSELDKIKKLPFDKTLLNDKNYLERFKSMIK